MQAAVDAKHNLVVATHTINKNDTNALTDIALEAKENLQEGTYTALVDKGYHNGRQIQQCKDANITTIVASSCYAFALLSRSLYDCRMSCLCALAW